MHSLTITITTTTIQGLVTQPYSISLAVTYDFQLCDILASVDSYEPVLPPFNFINFKCCSVSSLTVTEYSSD